MKGDPTPCLDHYDANGNNVPAVGGVNKADFDSFTQMSEKCGAKIAFRIDAALIDNLAKHNQGALNASGPVFDGIGDLCEDDAHPHAGVTRRPGSKQGIATRLKAIHFTLMPPGPPDPTTNVQPMTFKLDGSELTVGTSYVVANVEQQTSGWVFRNVVYDATIRTRVNLWNSCYAGDNDSCVKTSELEVTQTAPVLRQTCGAAPVITLDEVFVRAHDKSRVNPATLIDEVLRALTSVCSDAAGKAHFARVKAIHFTSSSSIPARGRQGEPTIALRRQGDDLTVTDNDQNLAGNVDDAARAWAKKNL